MAATIWCFVFIIGKPRHISQFTLIKTEYFFIIVTTFENFITLDKMGS